MLGKMLIKDIRRNPIIIATLFLFITLAALTVSGAVGVITRMSGALENLLEKSLVPHFSQMHAGKISQQAIDSFAAQHSALVESHQTSALLNIDGANLFLGTNESSEANSIQQNAFVSQNKAFGFLLGMDNQVLQVRDGEVAVPIFARQAYDLQIGDTVTVRSGSFCKEFTIVSFLRDAQMNATLSESKRYLVSAGDWQLLRQNIGEIEYLIEFRLHDRSQIGELESLYLSADLPQKGPSVTYPLYRLLNSISDGIVAAVMILVGGLLVMIALLCLRFTMMAAMEEDYREIGVMRAIGLHHRDIGKLYLTKYIVMAAAASVCGYGLSRLFASAFTANITLYMGEAEVAAADSLLPMLGAGLVFLAVYLLCGPMLRRFRRISAVEAIRTGRSSDSGTTAFRLCQSRLSNVNLFLGLKEVFGRFRVYGLLCFVYMVCAFLMILPLNTLRTVESPQYITYMGVGQSDMRIDVQRGEMNRQYEDLMAQLQNDSDIERYAGFYTGSYEALTPDGIYGTIRIESGDFSIFPLRYMQGGAPQGTRDIALSAMNAQEFGKKVGDSLQVFVDGREEQFTVCGIYQDATNAGKTAKAILPHDSENILWYTVYADTNDSTDIAGKVSEYAAAFPNAKVSEVGEFVRQTMGNVITQLGVAVTFAVGIALGIAVLITAMFFKMLTAKEASQISILRSVGFSVKDIRLQYLTRAVTVTLMGIAAGTWLAGSLGQRLAALMMTGMTTIEFVVDPLTRYLLCPASILGAVIVTLWLVMTPLKKASGCIIAVE